MSRVSATPGIPMNPMGSNGYLSLRFFKQLQHAKMQPRDVPPSFGIQDSLDGLLPLEDFSPVTVSQKDLVMTWWQHTPNLDLPGPWQPVVGSP